ncbi:hypothetical protein AB0P21_21335 [Kribbella sp. NPDC056861]|uniref:hypothetical protein n=1 Tax=Kribbella sp. NPDC056861 TaxID=3154857 RepID=UPI0034248A70
MTSAALVPFIVLAGVLFALIIGGGIWWSVRRQKALQLRNREAAQLGWQVVPPSPMLMEIAASVFFRGRPVVMYAGQYRGHGIHILDYTYTTTSGDSTSTNEVHLVALALPVALPPLELTQRSRTSRFFGTHQLELGNSAFNDAFRINCGDNRYAAAVLDPRVMEWMLFNPALEWQLSGSTLVSWGTGRFAIGDVQARLDAMIRLVDLIPPSVLREYGQPVY